MDTRRGFLTCCTALFVCCGLLPSAWGQTPGELPALTVEQIAAKLQAANARRQSLQRGYQSHRVMRVSFQSSLGNGEASETVDMTDLPTGKKTFSIVSAEGPQFIRDAVFQRAIDSEAAAAEPEAKRQSALTLENYTMQLVGEDRQSAGPCYVLQVSPRTGSPYAFIGKVWVQGLDFAVVRVEGKPAQDVSLWVTAGQFTTTYRKFGEFYLPVETTSSSQLRMGGSASLTIQYGPYRELR